MKVYVVLTNKGYLIGVYHYISDAENAKNNYFFTCDVPGVVVLLREIYVK